MRPDPSVVRPDLTPKASAPLAGIVTAKRIDDVPTTSLPCSPKEGVLGGVGVFGVSGGLGVGGAAMFHLRPAGVGSALPAASRARNAATWSPAARAPVEKSAGQAA